MNSFLLSLLILLAVTAGAIAQNYQPIYSNSLQVFYQEELYDYGYGSESLKYNMWGTRIDSTSVSPNGDTVLFNYPIVRDTIYEFGLSNWDGCAWYNAPNWCGYAVTIDTLGIIKFSNMWNDSISIHFNSAVGSEWVSFTYPNGDSLISIVDSVKWVDDNWTADSVKFISFRRISLGSQISDPVDTLKLELYKSQGFRETVDFLRFPFFSQSISRIHLDNIMRNSAPYVVDEPTANFIDYRQRPEPEIGDGFYTVFGGPGPNSNNEPYTQTFTSCEISNISGPNVDGELSVVFQQNRMVRSATQVWDGYGYILEIHDSDVYVEYLTETYVPVHDSIPSVTLITGLDSEDLFPREYGAAYLYRPDYSSCMETVTYSPCNPVFQSPSFAIDSCIERPLVFKCVLGETFTFSRKIGMVARSSWNSDHVPYWFIGESYSYFSTGSVLCGNYTMVDVPLYEESPAISIFPNPANQSFQIESEVAFDQLSICNQQGQLIWKSESQFSSYSIDCSQWPNGLYLIRSISDNGLQQQKLIASH